MRKATVTSGGGTGGNPRTSPGRLRVIRTLPFNVRAELERTIAPDRTPSGSLSMSCKKQAVCDINSYCCQCADAAIGFPSSRVASALVTVELRNS